MIRITYTQPLPTLTAIAFGVFALFSVASAQNNTNAKPTPSVDYSNWYQIEVIIFARHASASSEELWPKNLVLAYPPNVRYLTDPNAVQTPEEGTTSETQELEFNDNPTPETLAGASTETTATNEASSEGTLQDPNAPFTLLAKNQRLLLKESNSLNRERGVKVLLHEAWRQPVNALEEATAIVIEGGDKFGDHYELEGTLTIGVNRYLHAQTNLWLSQFEPNYGQDSYHWPPLPVKPNNTATLTQENLATEIMDNTNNHWAGTINLAPSVNSGFSLGTQTLLSPQETAVVESPYIISKIVKLDQRRKMRSGELHYIDHPLMGVIVQVKPFAPENTSKDGKE